MKQSAEIQLVRMKTASGEFAAIVSKELLHNQ
jgi:hypothetical protein